MTSTTNSSYLDHSAFFYGSRSGPLTDQEATRLFSLYCEVVGKWDGFEPYSNFFSSRKDCPYNWQLLDVQLSIDTIEQIAAKTGLILLRPINLQSEELVVGCGNYPIVDDEGDPIANRQAAYRLNHAHPNAITVNPDLASNPTIVGVFGSQIFPMLPSQQFKKILFEGVNMSDMNLNELYRITAIGGAALFSDDQGKSAYTFFSSQEEQTNGPLKPGVKDMSLLQHLNKKYPNEYQ